MKKFGTFAIVAAAAAGIMGAGAGLAAADNAVSVQPVVAPGEPNPAGTGSSDVLTNLVKTLTSGSTGTPAK
ncbi:hypothetical protein [Nocardia jejuensis]|uniref:hypothetical protein n=1 Tax=Nocardia jejuensis TaxID=328049 RepID=UPI00083086C4|nr:hypothetical protein [Nocardia jejuensis]